jgi:O-antigen/teichoic acid export membrane protein
MSTVTSKRSLICNALASAGGFAAQLAIAFFLCPLLVHGLGDRRYGMWSLVESLLAYLTLFDLGVAASVVRHVARLEATQDRAGVNRVFSTSLCVFGVAGTAAFLLALLVAFAGLPLLDVPADLALETRWMLILLGLNLALGLPLHVFASVLDGLGRYSVKTAITTAAALARVPVFLVVLWSGGGLLELAWAITGLSLLEHAALVVAAHRCLPGLRFSFGHVDRKTLRGMRGYSLNAFLAMLAGRISFQTDAVVIGLFLAPQFITFFAVAARLVEYAKNLLRSALTVLTPAITTLQAQGNAVAIRRAFLTATRWVLWLALPIQTGLLLLGEPFLRLWLGDRHAEESRATLLILSLPLAPALAQAVAGRVLYGLGKIRWLARAVLLEALANLLLSVALAQPLGIEGVAWGTCIPSVVVNLFLAAHTCQLLGIRVGDYLWRTCAAPCTAAVLLAAFWRLGASMLPPATWMALFGLGLTGAGLYFAFAVLVEMEPAAVARLLRRVPRLVESGEPPVGAFAERSPGARS